MARSLVKFQRRGTTQAIDAVFSDGSRETLFQSAAGFGGDGAAVAPRYATTSELKALGFKYKRVGDLSSFSRKYTPAENLKGKYGYEIFAQSQYQPPKKDRFGLTDIFMGAWSLGLGATAFAAAGNASTVTAAESGTSTGISIGGSGAGAVPPSGVSTLANASPVVSTAAAGGTATGSILGNVGTGLATGAGAAVVSGLKTLGAAAIGKALSPKPSNNDTENTFALPLGADKQQAQAQPSQGNNAMLIIGIIGIVLSLLLFMRKG